MKLITLVGIVLIVLGVIALAYQGISYTTKEKVVDLGPVEATAEEKHTLPLPPLVGVLSLIGGVALVIVGNRKV